MVSVSLLAFVLLKVNWGQLSGILAGLDLRCAASASALTMVLIGGLAVRWRFFLRQQNISVPFAKLLSLTWAGQFFNCVLPGSTGGDVVKIYQMCRLEPERKAAAAAAVFADRLSASFALLFLAAIAFTFEPLPLRVLSAWPLNWWNVSLACFGLTVAAFLAVWIASRMIRATQWPGRIVRMLKAVRSGFSFDFSTTAAVALALGLHLLNFFIVFLFAKALGLTITYSLTLAIMPVVLLMVMLPVTINGHGLRELLLIGYFNHLGIRLATSPVADVRDVVVALSVLIVANDLLWSLPGGLWYLIAGGRRVADLR